MHPDNRDFLEVVFYALYKVEDYPGSYITIGPEHNVGGKYTGVLKAYENSILNYNTLEEIYKTIIEKSDLPKQVKIRQPNEKEED